MKIFFKKHLFFIFFISFLLSLILFTYKDYGIPWDEKIFFNTGRYFVVKLFNFLNIPTNLSTSGFEPTPHHIKGHGVFMDMLTVFAGMFFPNFNFETLHLIRALFAVPIFLLLYWIVNKLLNKWYALLSLFFLLLSPRFYPEIFYNAVDIPTTLLFTICLAYFIYYAKTKQTVVKSIIFGLILAVTINQRLLLLYLPIVNLIFLFFQQKRNIKQLAIQQLTIFFSTIFFLHLTHPYLLTHPLTGLIDILNSAKQYPWNASVLFDGQFYQAGVNPLPWYYLPKTMSITIPLGTLFLFFVGNIGLLYRIASGRTSAVEESRNEVRDKLRGKIYLISVFYIPFILVFILKPTLYDSWRQFLFLTVPLMIIAVIGLDATLSFRAIAKNLAKRNYANAGFLNLHRIGGSSEMTIKGIIISMLCINLFFTAKKMIKLHPYEYLYYNSLVGGLKGAYGKYETDYWGLSYKEATLWFNDNLNDPSKQYKIYVEGDPLSSLYYLKPNVRIVTNTDDADYVFTFTRWDFDKRHLGKTIYIFEKDGVPINYIKFGGGYIKELKKKL